MYRICKTDGTELGVVEAVTYIKIGASGDYACATTEDATGVAFDGVAYSLVGHGEIDGESVVVSEVNAGQVMRDGEKKTKQMETAVKLYIQAADVPDTLALEMPDLFKTWAEVLVAGVELAANSILNKDGQLYRVVQVVTPQEHQPPDGEGMLAVYRPIDREHAGTQEDPIPFVYGMDTEKDKYYSYEGKTYLCNLAMAPCVWAPDTPGLWQWTEVE